MKENDRQLLENLCQQAGHLRPDVVIKTIEKWELLLSQLNLTEQDEIIELGPGVSPKISFALSGINFRGQLTVLDFDPKAISVQKIIAGRINSRYRMEFFTQDIYLADLSRYSIILGNHLIDDLIADQYSIDHSLPYEEIFNNPEKQKSLWQNIIRDRVSGEQTMARLAQKLHGINRGTKLIFSNYVANFDKIHQMQERFVFCNTMMEQLNATLINSGFISLPVRVEPGWFAIQRAE